MKSRLFCALIAAVLCPLLSATTTVSGSIKTLGGTSANNSFVRFWLRGCNGNQPRVNGVAIMPSNTNGQFYFDFPSSSTGTITGLLYSTRDAAGTGAGEIDCGGSHTAAWYGMQVYRNSVGGPETPVHAKNTGTLDVSNVTPTSTNPVVVAPTGDSTYARLDGGNQPFTGGIQAPSVTTAGAMTSGSVTTTSVNNTIYATAGETVAHAVARLPVGGGKIIFDVGAYPSGGVVISTKNIWLEGAGMPNYNSATAPTALTGGTIFQGPIAVIQGGDHFVIRNAGVDAGPTWVTSSNGGVATNALAISNNGQVVGAPPVQSPIIENVACLGFSATAAFHCMLVENVNGAYVHNVQTVYNDHGLVLKGSNSKVDGLYARGHSIDGMIVKSDAYAVASADELTNIHIGYLLSPGDTRGIILQGVGANLTYINLSNVYVNSPLNWGIQIQGTSGSLIADRINLTNINVDYPGLSPGGYQCVQLGPYMTRVHISQLNCANMAVGVVPISPAAGIFGDVSISDSLFINIATNAIETYGNFQVANNEFVNITGTAILNDSGTTYVGNNQFVSAGTNLGGAGTYGITAGSVSNSGTVAHIALQLTPIAVASLPTCNAGAEGTRIPVNNSNTATYNATIAAGGANHVEAYCNGTAWVAH